MYINKNMQGKNNLVPFLRVSLTDFLFFIYKLICRPLYYLLKVFFYRSKTKEKLYTSILNLEMSVIIFQFQLLGQHIKLFFFQI